MFLRREWCVKEAHSGALVGQLFSDESRLIPGFRKAASIPVTHVVRSVCVCARAQRIDEEVMVAVGA